MKKLEVLSIIKEIEKNNDIDKSIINYSKDSIIKNIMIDENTIYNSCRYYAYFYLNSLTKNIIEDEINYIEEGIETRIDVDSSLNEIQNIVDESIEIEL